MKLLMIIQALGTEYLDTAEHYQSTSLNPVAYLFDVPSSRENLSMVFLRQKIEVNSGLSLRLWVSVKVSDKHCEMLSDKGLSSALMVNIIKK